MNPADAAIGFRALADWLDSEGAILPDHFHGSMTLFVRCEDKTEFQAFARALGRGDKREIGGDLHLERAFGPVTVSGYTARENVCKRVVVGVKTETVLVPDPSVDVPMIECVEEVEQVEWVCGPIFADEVPE